MLKRFSRIAEQLGGTVTWASFVLSSVDRTLENLGNIPWCGIKGDDRRKLDFSEEVSLALILETSYVFFTMSIVHL